jgi:hypothetical protein
MTTISSSVSAFVAAQNLNRGQPGENVALDFDALNGAVPAGENGVTGFSSIAAGAAPVSFAGNFGAVLFSGANSSTAAAGGAADTISFNVTANNQITAVDNSTGQSMAISGVSYLVFDGGATTSTGAYESAYIVASGVNAQIAALYNAALGRVPDFAGLEFYAYQIANQGLTLHQAAVYFIASPEFQKDFPAAALPADDGGPNDQAFITALYQNILHRTPSASELAYYVSDLQGTLAGVAAQDRAQLLVNFALSPENQNDISGWLINTSNGDYAQAGAPVSAQTAITDGTAAGNINTALLTGLLPTGSVTASTSTGQVGAFGGNYDIGGGLTLNGHATISVTASDITVELSSVINTGLITGTADTIYGYSGGGSAVTLASAAPLSKGSEGGTVFLYGTGNTLVAGGSHPVYVTTPVTVYGFAAGDVITDQATASTPTQLLTGSSSVPVNGASLTFQGQGGIGTALVNVGTVAGDDPASMAAAANAAYKVGDVAGEHVIFFGQDAAGNTVVYDWRGDVHSTHQVDSTAFVAGEVLIGVQSSTITLSMFH